MNQTNKPSIYKVDTKALFSNNLIEKNLIENVTDLVPEWVHDVITKRAGILRAILVSVKTSQYCGS